jgi:phosphosulfolactate phosphohydrolase-like enzyme
MKKLRAIADEATKGISDVLGNKLSKKQRKAIEDLVEAAVIKGLLEGQHRAVDAAINCPEADQDLAHKIASEIRRKNDLMIVNLSSMR